MTINKPTSNSVLVLFIFFALALVLADRHHKHGDTVHVTTGDSYQTHHFR